MNNFKKTLESQQKVKEAVKTLLDYFESETDYYRHYESMCNAQNTFLMLYDHYISVLRIHPEDDECYNVVDINDFFFTMNELLKAIKPFTELLGQVNGKSNG